MKDMLTSFDRYIACSLFKTNRTLHISNSWFHLGKTLLYSLIDFILFPANHALSQNNKAQSEHETNHSVGIYNKIDIDISQLHFLYPSITHMIDIMGINIQFLNTFLAKSKG